VARFPGIDQEQVEDSSALVTGQKEHGAKRITVFMKLGCEPNLMDRSMQTNKHGVLLWLS